MNWRSLTPTEIKKATPVFVADLFFSLHYAAILYVNSSLLEEYFSLTTVSLLFVLGACGNIILFFLAPQLLKKVGNRGLFFIFVLFEALATAGLALAHTAHSVIVYFLILSSVSTMIYFCIDIFLEDASLEENTGEIRGIDLTIANTAIALGPLLITLFVVTNDFVQLYALSTILLFPLLYLLFFDFKDFKDGEVKPEEGRFLDAVRLWWRDRDIKSVTIARFILEFFYAVMVVYVPVYLHEHIGFSWSEIGSIFAIMLLPFIFLQLPAGEVADRWLGEKEIMTLGFICTGVAVLLMPSLDKSFALWTLALTLSRVGAALIEIMTDTFFFKHVDKRDTGLISVFRLSRPVGLVAGALLGIAVLAHYGYDELFFLLAVICVWGVAETAKLRDTK